MFSTTNTFKNSLYIGITYIVTIGFFMSLMHYQFGYEYKQPEMVYVLIFFEILASITLFWIIKKNNLWQDIGLVSLKNTNWKYAIPVLIIPIVWLAVWFFSLVQNHQIFMNNIWLLSIIFINMVLVGFTEEVVFRGFIFNSAKKKFPLWIAILIGAVAFSLLHSVNIFGGLPIEDVVHQLQFTFIAGILFILIFLKARNLWITIFFHFVFDLFLFSKFVISPDIFTVVSLFGTGFAGIIFIILAIVVFYENISINKNV